MKLNNFIGKEVQLYPNDTHAKFGIIEEISDKGFLVRITKVESGYSRQPYKVGEIHFISHSAGLTFKAYYPNGEIDS